jgi:hypothetical protein
MQILADLNNKFSENLARLMSENGSTLSDIDLKARAIAEIGEILSKKESLQISQSEIALIFHEVFSDLVLSVYFTGCALDKPAQTVLRRALELGIAIVYLWDLPHVFWGWKSHDYDLNFNDMLEHLSKEGYESFLASLNTNYHGENLFEYSEAKRLYRVLSNTIHGKITTHESNLPDRFSYNKQDLQNNLELIRRVQAILLQLFKKRFANCFAEVERRIPAISKVI